MKKELLLTFEITDACQNKCKHCHAESGYRTTQVDSKTIKKVIDEFSQLYEKGRIRLSGGEPTLHKDLIELIRYINYSTNLTKTDISTNCQKIAINEDYLLALKEAGLKSIATSLFGIKEEHDSFTERKGSFEEIIETSYKCLKHDLKVVWNIFAHKKNKDEIGDIIEMGEDIGIDRVQVLPFGLYGRGSKISDLRLSLEEKDKLVSSHPEVARSLRYCSESDIIPVLNEVCCLNWSMDFFKIKTNLDVYPCCYPEQNENYLLGNLRERSVKEVIASKPLIVRLVKEKGFESFADINPAIKYSIREEPCEACHKWVKAYDLRNK